MMTKPDSDERVHGIDSSPPPARAEEDAAVEPHPDAGTDTGTDWVELPLPRQSLFSPYALSLRKVKVWELDREWALE